MSEPMSDQRKVWAVSTGEYSDYGIVAYFSSEEAANRYADIHNSGKRLDDYRVEDGAEVWDDVPEPVDVLTLVATLTTPTQVTPLERVSRCVPGIDGPTPAACRADVDPRLNGGATITVRGTDHARVRKAMSERMARVIAEWDLLASDTTSEDTA